MSTRLELARKSVKGMLAPIPTVFDGSGETDLAMMERLTDWYLKAGVHGFFVLGSQGQGAACRIDQRKAVAETLVRRVGGRVPVIVQIGAVDPYSSSELAEHARGIGADAIAVVGPYYYSDRSEWELIEHYKAIDQAADMPMLLYNNPQYSGYSCPPSFMKTLSNTLPNVFGAKLADGHVGQASNYLSVLSRDFSVFIPLAQMIPGMQIGVRGSIASGAPVTVPEVGVALIDAIWAGDMKRALSIEILLLEHAERMAPLRNYGRRTTLEGLRMRGLDVTEYPRWPTREMTAEHLALYQRNISQLLDELSSITSNMPEQHKR